VYVAYVALSQTFIVPYRQLFGEDEDAGSELDVAEKEGENGNCKFPHFSKRH
jgi:hypothetical protein